MADVEMVQALIASGADVNSQGQHGLTSLHLASAAGQLGMVQLLTESGANVNAPGVIGCTPLHFACMRGHQKVAKLLITAGANINCKTNVGKRPLGLTNLLVQSSSHVNLLSADGFTPLYMACVAGHQSVVDLLLSSNADVDSATSNGKTPLYEACNKGHLDLVESLLSAGADANASDNQNISPLWVACKQRHVGVVKVLLSSGANVNSVQTLFGVTTLFLACEIGHVEAVHALLSAGADVNAISGFKRNTTESTDETTPLHIACFHGHLEVVQLLLSYGAELNSVQTSTGATALCAACRNGHLKVVQLLLSRVAVVNAVHATHETTALYIACHHGYVKIVELLLLSGADVNTVRKTDGGTALHMACCNGHVEVLQLLLSSQANINAVQRPTGATALYMACQNGYFDIVQLLLLWGADINRLCDDGQSPLQIASEVGHDDIVQLLLSSADYDRQYDNKRPSLHRACVEGHMETVQLLCDANVNGAYLINGTTPLFAACDGGHLQVIHFLLTQKPLTTCRSILNNMSELHAYCLSVCRQDVPSEDSIRLFIRTFGMLLSDYKTVCEMSDHLTTVLDMLLLTGTPSCNLMDTLIGSLGYFMAIDGKLNKPLYAILPETESTKGKLLELCSLHTTFSALVCAVSTKHLKVIVQTLSAEYGKLFVVRLCRCLFHKSILHIIAQYISKITAESEEKAQLFLDLGVDVWAKDINGRLPLHVACMMGNIALARCYWTAMCKTEHLSQNGAEYNDIVYQRQNYGNKQHVLPSEFPCSVHNSPFINRLLDNVGKLPMDYTTPLYGMDKDVSRLPNSVEDITHTFGTELSVSQLQSLRFADVSNDDMEHLLFSPPSGKVIMTGENRLIFSSVLMLVQIICDCIGNLNACFACKPVLSGSVREGTKATMLDELDFCLKMVNFDAIGRTELMTDKRGSLVASCTPSITSYIRKYQYWRPSPDGTQFFASTLYCAHFWQLLLKAVRLPVVSKYVTMSRITIDDCKRKSGFVGTLYITWYGETYRCLPISVDLVPVVELEGYYCLLRPRYFDHRTVGAQLLSCLELSCNKKDQILVALLSQPQRDGYCLAKIIRGLSKSLTHASGKALPSNNVIQSYLLKTALMWTVDPKDQFHQYYPKLNKNYIFEEVDTAEKVSSSTSYIHDVRMWTVKIFTMLKHVLQSGYNIHTYNLPYSKEWSYQQNVVHVRDKDLAVALCEKCIEIARPTQIHLD